MLRNKRHTKQILMEETIYKQCLLIKVTETYLILVPKSSGKRITSKETVVRIFCKVRTVVIFGRKDVIGKRHIVYRQ